MRTPESASHRDVLLCYCRNSCSHLRISLQSFHAFWGKHRQIPYTHTHTLKECCLVTVAAVEKTGFWALSSAQSAESGINFNARGPHSQLAVPFPWRECVCSIHKIRRCTLTSTNQKRSYAASDRCAVPQQRYNAVLNTTHTNLTQLHLMYICLKHDQCTKFFTFCQYTLFTPIH